VRYQGREIDPIALWSEFVDFPPDTDPEDTDSPLLFCPNPAHDNSKTPAFRISFQKPKVHCFAWCGISGSYEHALGVITGEDRRACRRLVFKAKTKRQRVYKRGKEPPRSPNIVVPDVAISTYIPQAGIEYLSSRGINGSDIAKWELAWDTEQLRIVIPAKDHKGRLRFYIRRSIRDDDWPRYLYPDGADKNRLLFGACAIDLGLVQSRGLVIAEGSIDVIRNHHNGLRNTVGLLGSYISDHQVRLIGNLRPRRFYVMPDRDLAGVRLIEQAKRRLKGRPLFICRLPKGRSDPAELTEKEAQRSFDNAIPYRRFAQLAGLN
jgi:DNA primase